MRALLPLLLTACGPDAGPADRTAVDSADSADSASPAEGPLTPRFSFVVIADPHVYGPGEHADRLAAAVSWVNEHAAERDLQLVVVLGDIAWNDGIPLANELLGELTVPWVPVLGDNEIQSGDAEAFHVIFADQVAALHDQLDAFSIAPTPVDDPVWGRPSWLQNLAFTHQGVRFISADWSSRDLDTLWGETPDLHEFEGGTWPWLEAQLSDTSTLPDDAVVLLSHMPLFSGPGGLTVDEAARVVETLDPHRDVVWANLAGHLHGSSSMDWDEAGLEVHVTDATWDDDNAVRVITVTGNDQRFAYAHDLVVVQPGASRAARAYWDALARTPPR